MTIPAQTIPEFLVSTRGNQSEVARQLQCTRGTIAKYAKDGEAKQHAVVNGRLMVYAGAKGKGRWKEGA